MIPSGFGLVTFKLWTRKFLQTQSKGVRRVMLHTHRILLSQNKKTTLIKRKSKTTIRIYYRNSHGRINMSSKRLRKTSNRTSSIHTCLRAPLLSTSSGQLSEPSSDARLWVYMCIWVFAEQESEDTAAWRAHCVFNLIFVFRYKCCEYVLG